MPVGMTTLSAGGPVELIPRSILSSLIISSLFQIRVDGIECVNGTYYVLSAAREEAALKPCGGAHASTKYAIKTGARRHCATAIFRRHQRSNGLIRFSCWVGLKKKHLFEYNNRFPSHILCQYHETKRLPWNESVVTK